MDLLLKNSQINNVPAQELHSLQSSEVTSFPVFDPVPKLNNYVTVLVCCTGSVATIKLPEIIAQLQTTIANVYVEVVMTEKAKHFCAPDSKSIPAINVHSDSEWLVDKSPLLPDELALRADILLIAPLDANTLAKIANGLCDNLLTTIVRNWDFSNKIAICCPAMNTQMWIHPITEVHIKQLQSLGFIIIQPITKKLACGDFGVGAMAEPNSIATTVKHYAESMEINASTKIENFKK